MTAAPWRWPILWNRGVLDVVVANQRGPADLQEHRDARESSGSNLSSKARRATAVRSARRSTLYWNGQQQVQEVSGGSGFAAQNDRRLHFGLGKNPQIEKAVIRWPSGKVQTIDSLVAGKLYKLRSRNEPAE